MASFVLRQRVGFAYFAYTAGMRKHDFEAFFQRLWKRLGVGPARPPRVTDDGEDDGLSGAPVPQNPVTPLLLGAATLATPHGPEERDRA